MSEAGPAAAGGCVFIVYTYAPASGILNDEEKCIHLPPYLRRALLLAAQGMTAREAALLLKINHKTVENYRREAMRRLGARNLVNAVALALILGLLFTDY